MDVSDAGLREGCLLRGWRPTNLRLLDGVEYTFSGVQIPANPLIRQKPVLQVHDSSSQLGQSFGMRHNQYAAFLSDRIKQLVDELACGGVEVTCGFVGQQQRRIVRRRRVRPVGAPSAPTGLRVPTVPPRAGGAPA